MAKALLLEATEAHKFTALPTATQRRLLAGGGLRTLLRLATPVRARQLLQVLRSTALENTGARRSVVDALLASLKSLKDDDEGDDEGDGGTAGLKSATVAELHEAVASLCTDLLHKANNVMTKASARYPPPPPTAAKRALSGTRG